jgi:signal transduction histidine kinase
MQRDPVAASVGGVHPEGAVVLRVGLTEVELRAWGAFEGELLKLLHAALLSAPTAEIAAARWEDLQAGGAVPVLLLGAQFGERETLRLLRRLRGAGRWVPAVLLLAEPRRALAEAALAEGICDLVPVSEIDGDRMARALRFAAAVSEARLREEGWSRRCSELEIRFEGLLDLLDDGVLLVDDRRRIRWASRTVQDLLGLAPAELVGKPFAALGWVQPDRAWNGVADLLAAEGARLEIERPDGTRRRLNVRARKLDAVDGRGERLRLVLLRDRGTANQGAEERRLIGLGRLATGVGHDVNNLLAPVLGYAELVRSSAREPERVIKYAEEIERSAVAAADLVRRMLQLARSTTSAAVELDADELVESTLPLLRTLVGASVTLGAELGAGLIRVHLRAGELEQLLLNLVGNARDAMPGGGGIRLRTRHDAEGLWVLEVEDDGVGIAPDHLARLFEPGFTTKREGAGGGLGLWIVRGIVEEAGGEILVESRPGAGSKVTLRLPSRAAPAARL